MDLSLIPAGWMPAIMWLVVFLISVLGFMGFVAALLAGVKKLLGAPAADDPPWKVKAYSWLKYADWVAANSPRAVDLLKMLQLELELEAQRRALAQHRDTIDEQKNTIRVQSAVIRASQRPPAADNDNGGPR